MEHADVRAMGHLAGLHERDSASHPAGIQGQTSQRPAHPWVIARGSYCAIGDPDHVADELARLNGVGFDGLALNFVNYLDELPYFAQEVLPRLEKHGLRAAI